LWAGWACIGRTSRGLLLAAGVVAAGLLGGAEGHTLANNVTTAHGLPDGWCTGRNYLGSCCPEGAGGLLLPIFPYEYTWARELRAFLYIVGLLWCFLGVSILCDAFMNGIEAITSQTKTKKVPKYDAQGNKKMKPDGSVEMVEVSTEVWNPAVANLTLMALGSSTPEIMLSIIEIFSAKFFSGALGPGTVVGSAAFNLFVISALCITALPDNDTRKIDNLQVFALTSIHSLVAYSWLVIIVQVTSKDVVDIAESVITLLLLPWLTFWVWCADRDWFRNRQVFPEAEEGYAKDDGEESKVLLENGETNGKATTAGKEGDKMDGEARDSVIRLHKTSSNTHAVIEPKKKPVSYAKRRHEALKSFTGGLGKTTVANKDTTQTPAEEEALGKLHPIIQFEAGRYAFMEDVGNAVLKVTRTGVMDTHCKVMYATVDGTAVDGKDYHAASGGIDFAPGVGEMEILVGIVEDDNWNEDKDFVINLVIPAGGAAKLGHNTKAVVTIVDVDNPGEFSFLAKSQAFLSTDSKAVLVVQRALGCSGDATVKVRTREGTAKTGTHFKAVEHTLLFHKDQAAKTIEVELNRSGWTAEQPDEPTKRFFVELSDPTPEGGATLGETTTVEVLIMWASSEVGPSSAEEDGDEDQSWGGQFRKALSVNDGEDVQDASSFELVMHYISVTWKLFAAIIPPTTYASGWATFWAALALIGLVTALIMDLASLFGCLVGLDDAVTAITIVALGTSVPDTFASMMAARQDDNADNSIGNITGSNSVNVFLGIGLPWLIAAVYWQSVGATPEWHAAHGPGGLFDFKEYDQYKESGAFVVIGGSLGFNTLIYSILAVAGLALLTFRRAFYGAELGGKKSVANFHGMLMGVFWLIYIIVSSLRVYHPESFVEL